jgi:hypothetical protein
MPRYPAGSVIELSTEVTSLDTDALVDPSTISLSVYDAADVLVLGPVTPTRLSLGTFRYETSGLPAANDYQAVWTTTGAGQGTATELFDVVAVSRVVRSLASFGQLTEGPLADLVEGYDTASAQLGLMTEATRACETAANRRLAPFVGLVETCRAEGVDPDEYPAGSGLPLTLETLGRASVGSVLGVGDQLVRHVWLAEHAPRYPELWTYADVSVRLTDTAGAVQVLTPRGLPAADSGHLWLPAGTWAPVGSWIEVVYSGGYTTVPDDLVRACKYMAASIAATDLDPLSNRSSALRAAAEKLLKPYART